MRANAKLLAVALAATTAFAGCGSDDNTNTSNSGSGADASTPTSLAQAATATPMPTSPAESAGATDTQKWAKDVCAKLADATTAVKPPEVNPSTPKETKASLKAFFDQIAEQLDKQGSALKKVGPPPGPNGKAEYKKALAKLDEVQTAVERVAVSTKNASANNAAQMQELMTELGKQLQSLANYEGPISELMQTKSVGKQLSAEPACKTLGLTEQSTVS